MSKRITVEEFDKMKLLRKDGKPYKEIGAATGYSTFAVYRKLTGKKYYARVKDLPSAQNPTESAPENLSMENS